MAGLKQTSISLLLLAGAAVAIPAPLLTEESIFFRVPDSISTESVYNVHVSYGNTLPQGDVRVVYGDCASTHAGQNHHEVASFVSGSGTTPDRLVWAVPKDAAHGGCLHAYSGPTLVGRSEPVSVSGPPLRKRASLLHEVGDSNGLWFDGVRYLESCNQSSTVSTKAKRKRIAIIGGGMSGLLTSLLLTSVGIDDWHIIESTERVGGRIRTKYLNGTSPEDYQYQEMGPMRFPVSIKYADTNETLDIQDHKMVFQLADVLNEMNTKDHPELAVNFIPWIQSSPNTPANSRGARLSSGRIPSSAEIAADPSLQNPPIKASNVTAAELGSEAVEHLLDITPERLRNISTNVFKAHREAIDKGLFHWSETAYLKYHLGLDTDTVDFLSGSGNDPMWGEWYDTVYFSATNWRTIDKGLNSLPKAFAPHIEGKITYGRKVEGLTYNDKDNTVFVNWREDEFDIKPKYDKYDYAIVAVPFSKVRLWRMPEYSSLLSRAISTLEYQQSCKVALHYETRFWEAQENPIFGGCGSVDIPGIGSICYPAYEINSTGPGVILASYASGTMARSLAALSEKDHVALVQRAMVEVHGEVAAEQFTGSYERQCWEVDEHQAGAWASPTVGQQELFIPAYHRTEFNTIFVGEHTSITHAWIFSALESAVRGTTQLLLDLGLVDEAKQIVDTWMARWITI
ncbi:related to L-amino-acid oxidase [Cephalotrichum gorgonifer]|uniref:Related to L-amino-acid oxidase n=1 Tax=Cephalotrichum gorgonifer TaxID=2041049 RepID=A0AAE8SW50_9PEZI|nr:related to L-amino-acid oxidase [Cephalotrichum gorgonifer]